MDLLLTIINLCIILGILLAIAAVLVYVERRLLAFMQDRLGPNRVGYQGILQPLADGIKLLMKEESQPQGANRLLFILSPALLLTVILLSFAVLPIPNRIADINIALLYVLALSSLGVYGVVMAGWSSNSKYPLLGGIRAAAQMISYELSMGLSIMGVVMMAGSFSLVEIVNAQGKLPYILYQPLGFFVYFVSAVAETKRLPFDLPEAENELVAGYHTEYSSMKFALFYVADYLHIVLVGALAAVLFFGGWKGPLLPDMIWFFIKTGLFVVIFIWLRGTLPRLRFDQLMSFGWKILLPLALVNVLITGFVAIWVLT
jgi:NADH-quinone oxidoreductase subunit H